MSKSGRHDTGSAQALLTMLKMQQRINSRIHPDWVEQQFPWYRAVWVECGELLEHHGYKWWKQQEVDLPQVQLEVIDIWHFGMSALFAPGRAVEQLAQTLAADFENYRAGRADLLEATEALALHCLASHSFSVPHFCALMTAAQLDFEALYRAYVGKNVLNFFRQDHGYQDGSYSKHWAGREDNEHLLELTATLDMADSRCEDRLYAALAQRYGECRGES